MDKQIEIIIEDLYDKYGNEVFEDKNRLSSFLTDVLVDFPTEMKQLQLVASEDIVTKIINELSYDNISRANVYIDHLFKIYGMPTDSAMCAINVFLNAIHRVKLTNSKYPKQDVVIASDTISTPITNGSNDFEMSLRKYNGTASTLMIPKGVTEIGENAFKECSSLNTVIIPGYVKKIGDNAFQFCRNLKKVIIENGVKEIGKQAFNASAIQSVILPDTICKIGSGAFMACPHLEMVSMPAELTTIETETFRACRKLSKLNMPKCSIKRIEAYAFHSCEEISPKIFPASVRIDKDAFYNCKTKEDNTHLSLRDLRDLGLL